MIHQGWEAYGSTCEGQSWGVCRVADALVITGAVSSKRLVRVVEDDRGVGRGGGQPVMPGHLILKVS